VRREARLVDISTFTTGDDRIRALTTAPRIKPTSIFLRSARRPNPGRRSTYRRGIIVQTTGTGSILWLLAIGLYLFAIPQGKPWIFFPQVFVAIAVVLFSWCIVQVILSGRDWRSMRLAARSADRYFMDITL
jgi:threonine/homoserine/homoserine lactone efflux protein